MTIGGRNRFRIKSGMTIGGIQNDHRGSEWIPDQVRNDENIQATQNRGGARQVGGEEAEAMVPIVEHPKDISVVVSGGDLEIAQQAYLPTWGFPACRVQRVVDLSV